MRVDDKLNDGKFVNAEALWFWYCYSRKVRGAFTRGFGNATLRPCELVDVEAAITRLYLRGELTDKQLAVLKRFGFDRRRSPNKHIWSERDAFELWNAAMQTMQNDYKIKDWLTQERSK